MSHRRVHPHFVHQQTTTGTQTHSPPHSSTISSSPFQQPSSIPSSFNSSPITSTSGTSGYSHLNSGTTHRLQPIHFSHTNSAINIRASTNIRSASARRTRSSVPHVSYSKGMKASTSTKPGSSRSYISTPQANGISSTYSSGYSASSHRIPRMHSQTTSSTTGSMNRSKVTSSYASGSYSASARPQTQWYSQGIHHNSALHLNTDKIPGHRASRHNFPWTSRRNKSTSPSIREMLRRSM